LSDRPPVSGVTFSRVIAVAEFQTAVKASTRWFADAAGSQNAEVALRFLTPTVLM
jgi:hypothetical protein